MHNTCTRTRIEDYYGIETSIQLTSKYSVDGDPIYLLLDIAHDAYGDLCPSYRIMVNDRNVSDFDNLKEALVYFNGCV